jgi:hypothetical protein
MINGLVLDRWSKRKKEGIAVTLAKRKEVVL